MPAAHRDRRNVNRALPAAAGAGGPRRRRPAPRHIARALAAGLLVLALASGAGAQGTKRLAPPAPTGLPWSGCTDVEGFVVDVAGQYTVQSARCGDARQIWLLQRAGSGEAGGSEPAGAAAALVLDQHTVRPLRPGEMLSAGPYCRAHGRELRWVAIYAWKQRKRISGQSGGILEAWMPDLQEARLKPVPRSLLRAATCTALPDE
jgi:hypothetical protein